MQERGRPMVSDMVVGRDDLPQQARPVVGRRRRRPIADRLAGTAAGACGYFCIIDCWLTSAIRTLAPVIRGVSPVASAEWRPGAVFGLRAERPAPERLSPAGGQATVSASTSTSTSTTPTQPRNRYSPDYSKWASRALGGDASLSSELSRPKSSVTCISTVYELRTLRSGANECRSPSRKNAAQCRQTILVAEDVWHLDCEKPAARQTKIPRSLSRQRTHETDLVAAFGSGLTLSPTRRYLCLSAANPASTPIR